MSMHKFLLVLNTFYLLTFSSLIQLSHIYIFIMRIKLSSFILVILLVVTDTWLVIVVARPLLHVHVTNRFQVDLSRDHRRTMMVKSKKTVSRQHYCVGNDSVLDDKRVVPTGSNPLHNR
ncbi:hypothetical protein RND81_11G138200 [Saponaria officinalis]|uniref:Uncharacterized protein n=1 Tax=Saponaria officinalis TaxID=3572 RepID=A0AAW1HMB1_SAPOF